MLETITVPAQMLPNGGVNFLRPVPEWANGLTTDFAALFIKPEEASIRTQDRQTKGNAGLILKKLRERSFPAELRRPTEQVVRDVQAEKDAW